MEHLTLYHGGTILTMEEPLYAEAMLVKNGRIAAVGSLESVNQAAGQEPGARLDRVDLRGRTLMPAFLDPHSHFSAYANSLLQIPLDDAVSVSEIQDKIRSFIAEQKPAPGQWLTAKGYDHNNLPGRRHITRFQLDDAAPENPLVVSHQSGHVGVFNSLGLSAFGVTPSSPVPDGGMMEIKDGELTGYMEENAFLNYFMQVPSPDGKDLMAAFRTAQERYAAHGITTVQEGMMVDEMIPLVSALLSQNFLKLDLVGFPGPQQGAKLIDAFRDCVGAYRGHFKIGGYKIFLDGSPQGRTAWMRRPYLPDESGKTDYRGYNTLSDQAVLDAVNQALDSHLQILAHCNGDAAAEQYLSAWEAAASKRAETQGEETALAGIRSIRPVIVHAQLIGLDQLPRVKRLGLLPSFFVAHVYHWGDTHIRNFGMERASHISPAASALKEGIRFTFHQDSPVIEPDMLETVWCAVNRRTKAGVLLGDQERISVLDALKAVTINAAYQYFEEDTKGSLAPGKRADLVILTEDPLTADPERIREITVVETIKDGTSIYKNPTFLN